MIFLKFLTTQSQMNSERSSRVILSTCARSASMMNSERMLKKLSWKSQEIYNKALQWKEVAQLEAPKEAREVLLLEWFLVIISKLLNMLLSKLELLLKIQVPMLLWPEKSLEVKLDMENIVKLLLIEKPNPRVLFSLKLKNSTGSRRNSEFLPVQLPMINWSLLLVSNPHNKSQPELLEWLERASQMPMLCKLLMSVSAWDQDVTLPRIAQIW